MPMRAPLSHPTALQTLYADIAALAARGDAVTDGPPGSLLTRRNAAGFTFYALQRYDAKGLKHERYVAGPVGDAAADASAEALRAQLEASRALARDIRLLGREGYILAPPETFRTVVSLHRYDLFRDGLTLVGSYAYGALLNHLGLRAGALRTLDIDLARGASLRRPGRAPIDIRRVLTDSQLTFVEIPGLDPATPATSFKALGKVRLHVDLLAPSRNSLIGITEVPELRTFATTLPFLAYLVAETYFVPLLGRDGACMVRVPTPERFAIHKLLVSQLRIGQPAKARKDLEQAATLLLALQESDAAAVDEAIEAMPVAGRRKVAGAWAAAGLWPRA